MTRLDHRLDGPEDAPVLIPGSSIFDVRERLHEVRVPTLVVAEPRTSPCRSTMPLDHAETLAQGIPGAALVIVPGAAHLANLERPEAVTHVMVRHLERTQTSRKPECSPAGGYRPGVCRMATPRTD